MKKTLCTVLIALATTCMVQHGEAIAGGFTYDAGNMTFGKISGWRGSCRSARSCCNCLQRTPQMVFFNQTTLLESVVKRLWCRLGGHLSAIPVEGGDLQQRWSCVF